MITLGLGLAAVAIHKEKQIERGLAQVTDVGATDPADITVHASFLSLISASVGLILNGLGNNGKRSLTQQTAGVRVRRSDSSLEILQSGAINGMINSR